MRVCLSGHCWRPPIGSPFVITFTDDLWFLSGIREELPLCWQPQPRENQSGAWRRGPRGLRDLQGSERPSGLGRALCHHGLLRMAGWLSHWPVSQVLTARVPGFTWGHCPALSAKRLPAACAVRQAVKTLWQRQTCPWALPRGASPAPAHRPALKFACQDVTQKRDSDAGFSRRLFVAEGTKEGAPRVLCARARGSRRASEAQAAALGPRLNFSGRRSVQMAAWERPGRV